MKTLSAWIVFPDKPDEHSLLEITIKSFPRQIHIIIRKTIAVSLVSGMLLLFPIVMVHNQCIVCLLNPFGSEKTSHICLTGWMWWAVKLFTISPKKICRHFTKLTTTPIYWQQVEHTTLDTSYHPIVYHVINNNKHGKQDWANNWFRSIGVGNDS